MADRPIIFSGPLIRALLAGTKTQTRRVLKPQPYNFVTEGRQYWNASGCVGGRISISDADLLRLHGWESGRRLWVREAWAHDAPDLETARARFEDALGGAGYGPYYRATEPEPDTLSWRSPIHMPRWASRLTLTVTEVRVQRLQGISEEDARAEGCRAFGPDIADPDQGGPSGDAADAYRRLWNSLHGPDAWAANPWVAALTFTTTPANIDSLPK